MAQGCPNADGHKGSRRPSASRDDSLTSLVWLRDFSARDTSMAKPPWCLSGPEPLAHHQVPSSAAPCSPLAADPACVAVPHAPCQPLSSSTSVREPNTLVEDLGTKSNPHAKPPYSYTTLICLVMEASEKPQVPLSAIYKWITDTFCYFQHADPSWQNFIWHNLSLKKCFIKVPREKGEWGKGGFGKLDPQYADRLKKGALIKQRMSPVQIHPAFTKIAQQEVSPVTSACTSSNILSTNRESQQLLKELEEVTSNQNWKAEADKAGQKRKQPLPNPTAKVARLSNLSLLSQEEQTELESLIGDCDWEAILDANLNGDFSTFGDLELLPPVSPIRHDPDMTAHGQHSDCPQGQEQEQVLTESDQNSLDCEESFMATAVLQHLWDEGTSDCLASATNVQQWLELSDTSVLEDSTLLEEQKSVMQKCSEERRKLAAEWAEFHSQQQLSKERMERDMDRARQMDAQREGTIVSLAKEQAELKIRGHELKAKEEQLVRDRELLEEAWRELRREKEVNRAMLSIQQQKEEMKSMSKGPRQGWLSTAHQRSPLEQLHQELPHSPVTLLPAGQALGALGKVSPALCSLTAAAPHARASAPGFLPPAGVLPWHSPGQGRESLAMAGPAELYAQLLLLRHRAQQDHDFLEEEQLFLQTLKQAPNAPSLSD
ncbi:LOW QUALITY PROTEIN: forkhead box protein J1-B-like [Aegotheles albertisi]